MVNGLDSIRGAFAQVRRRSELVAVEILWKWAWAVAVVVVAAASALLFLDSVALSPAELRGLRSRLPWLVVLTLRRLFERHMPALVQTALVVVMAAALLWWLAASVVRSGLAGALLEESNEQDALARFAPAVRRSFPAYLASHLWSLGVAVVTLWLGAQILLRTTTGRAQLESDWLTGFVRAVVGVAALLFFWQLIAWILGLGRAASSRHGCGFLKSVGYALHLLGSRPVDVLFVATTMFLLRAVAIVLAAGVGLGILYAATTADARLAPAALVAACMLLSATARWLYVVQQAAFLALTRN